MSEANRRSAMQRLLGWLAGVTDASLLGVPRFFGLIYGHIDHRLPLGEAWRAALRRRLPAHAGWQHALGGVTYLLFLILIGTGVLLSFYYRPSPQEAYYSVQYLESEISFGWLVRNVHFWAANLVMVAVLLHLLYALLTAAYKAPRETNWLVGILLLLVLLAFGMTGYLLPWDQWAYWTTSHELSALSQLPVIGTPVVALLRADEVISGATLSRFFAFHVIILPWIALLLLGIHFQIVRKYGIAPPLSGAEAQPGEPFYPQHALRQLIAVLLTIGIVVTLAAMWPRTLSEHADPFALAPEVQILWFPGAVLQAASHHLGGWGLGLLLVLAVLLALLPLLDRSPERRPLRRPLITVGAVLLVAGVAVLSLVGYRIPEATSPTVSVSPPQAPPTPADSPAGAPRGQTP
ncbi:MAG: cytochrome b N-terminal domain-containing protein [Gemmatimonadetes bacterium]|nr:cytochrome b N-terminal domain-containing protein [Gemmatimonadota bacterium]